jgi:hypothetical protein
MNVFVVGTGRCGTVSFATACKFMTSYTVGHETVCSTLMYPDQHIEVNGHLNIRLTQLIVKYPDALYVHLIRRKVQCVHSIAALSSGSVMQALHLIYPSVYPTDPLEIADVLYESVNWRIQTILQLVKHKMTIKLETVKSQWAEFWQRCQAEGDYQQSLKSWDTPHNVLLNGGA